VHRRRHGHLHHPGAPGLKSNYITPEGERRLRAELDQLWRVERPRVTQEVSDAAAQGDRSENAEYIYGKKRLREIDRRVRFLTKRLEELNVVEPHDHGDGKVYFGAWVKLEDEDGEVVEYRIVGPDEFDPKARRISMDSPVGSAILGKRVGDEVLVRRPRGDAYLTVLEVRYGEEEA
jgi:transcription elongation factor GreB